MIRKILKWIGYVSKKMQKCKIVAKIRTPETSTSTAVNKFAPGEMLSCNKLRENGITTLQLDMGKIV